MKFVERVIQVRIRRKVHIDGMQFGFSSGKGKTGAIFCKANAGEVLVAKKGALVGICEFGKSF